MKADELQTQLIKGFTEVGVVMRKACDVAIEGFVKFGQAAVNTPIGQKVKLESFCFRRWSLHREGCLVSLEVDVFLLDDWNACWVSRLYTPPKIRRRGYARQAMQMLCDAADAEGIRLVLGINPYGDMSYADLERFYRSFGFVKNDELATILVDDGLFVREPRY